MSETVTTQQHRPFVSETTSMKELTLRAVLLGLVMSVVLGAANAYLGLHAGQTIAATYPAAVIGMAFLRALVAAKEVLDGDVDTNLIERSMEKLGAVPQPPDHAAAARAVEALIKREQARLAARAMKRSNEKRSPWDMSDAFALSGTREANLAITVDGARARARVRYGYEPRASVEGADAAECVLVEAGGSLIALRDGRQTVVALADADAVDAELGGAGGLVTAPMHGKASPSGHHERLVRIEFCRQQQARPPGLCAVWSGRVGHEYR